MVGTHRMLLVFCRCLTIDSHDTSHPDTFEIADMSDENVTTNLCLFNQLQN
jgi:hypothetical protein